MQNILNTSGNVIFTSESANNLREAVIEAVSKGISLADADFRGANLRGANLRGADFTDADFTDADLTDADFTDADFRNANLECAVLIGANLRNANLTRAILRGADFRGADFRNADLDFSAWPLWCGSLGVEADDKLVGQLLFHAFDLAKSSGIALKMTVQQKDLISKSSPVTKHGKII